MADIKTNESEESCDFTNYKSVFKGGRSRTLKGNKKKVLESLERVVESGMKTYIEVGVALALIRDNKLYRSGKYIKSTWAEYLDRKWGIQASYAAKLIMAKSVIDGLKSEQNEILEMLPDNEAQCRMLRRLENEEKRGEVWNAVCKGEGKNTANAIEKKIRELYPKALENKNDKTVAKFSFNGVKINSSMSKDSLKDVSLEDLTKLKEEIDKIKKLIESTINN